MRESAAFDDFLWDRKAGSNFINVASRKKITDLNDYGQNLLGKTFIPFLDNQPCSSSMLLSRWKYCF